MKRVLFCAFLCMLLIGTGSALNLTPSKIPAATLKVTAAPTLQYIVKPDIHVTFQPGVSPTLDPNHATVTFESTPSGAFIYAYGSMVSEYLTPYTVKVFAPQIAPITISYPGYQDYCQTLNFLP